MFLKNDLYFHRIDTYCIINYDIKYIFTLKAVLIKAFLVRNFFSSGQKWDFKVFFLYDVINYSQMEYMRKWPSMYRVACPMYLWNLHFSIVSEARNAQITFVEKPQIKIFSFQNGKHGCLMQYLTRKRFEGYCCESEYILFLFLIF